MSTERERKGYWSQVQNKPIFNPPEKIQCTLCGKEIQPGCSPQFRYSVGIICKECSDKGWKDKNWMRKKN